jgi:hypothetical protein
VIRYCVYIHLPQTKKGAKKPAARETTTPTRGLEIPPAALEDEDVEEEDDNDELIEPPEPDLVPLAVSVAIPTPVEVDIEPPAPKQSPLSQPKSRWQSY